VRYQLLAAGVLIAAMVDGIIRMADGRATVLATVALFWAAFDLSLLSVLIQAVRYRGSEPAKDPDQ
jgi:cellulose synthase (UDP-forming)